MDKKLRNILIIIVALLAIGSCIFMFIISPIQFGTGDRKMPKADSNTSEILNGTIIEQKFINRTKEIQEIAIVFHREYSLEENTNIYVELLDGSNVLAQNVVNADDVQSEHRTYIKPTSPISGYVGKELTLKIYTDSSAGTGLSVMCDSTDSSSSYTYAGNQITGTLCFSITGK